MRELFSADLEKLNLEWCELVGLLQHEHQQHKLACPDDPALGVRSLYSRLLRRGLPVLDFPFRNLVSACRVGWMCGILDWDIQVGRVRVDSVPGAGDVEVWMIGDEAHHSTVEKACRQLGFGFRNCPTTMHESYHFKPSSKRVVILKGPWTIRAPKNLRTICNLVYRMRCVRLARDLFNQSSSKIVWQPWGVDVPVHRITHKLRQKLNDSLDDAEEQIRRDMEFWVVDDAMLYLRDVDGTARLLLAANDHLNAVRPAGVGSTLDGELTGVSVAALYVNSLARGSSRRRCSLRDSACAVLAI